MSLLNMASDGMPNVLLAAYRCLLAHGSMPEEKLVDLCAPDIVGVQRDRLKGTIRTWARLNFLDRTEGEIRLAPDLPPEVRNARTGEAALRRVLRDLIFRGENNEPFWGSEGVRAADFTRGLAWCLAMDPVRLQALGYAPVNELEVETLPADVEVFRNDTRWNGFKAWAVFLKFARPVRFPRGALMVDPARAIAETLPSVFAEATELDQRDFLNRLHGRMPVFDGGAYRREVEQVLIQKGWRGPNAGEVSASLSLALLTLEHDGKLELLDRADPAAGRMTLLGHGGRTIRGVSHIRYRGEAS